MCVRVNENNLKCYRFLSTLIILLFSLEKLIKMCWESGINKKNMSFKDFQLFHVKVLTKKWENILAVPLIYSSIY